jgi:hypothetical protein
MACTLYQGMIRDFVMLNAPRETHAADAAIRQAIASSATPSQRAEDAS